MTKCTAEGAKQIVGFALESGEEQTFTSGALMLFKIPKSRTNVNFVFGDATVNVAVE